MARPVGVTIQHRPKWAAKPATPSSRRPDGDEAILTDHVMPAQFYSRSAACQTPEVRLMIAVLENALDELDATHGIATRRAIRKRSETLRWIEAESSEWVFSFASICDATGLSATAIRAHIRARFGVSDPIQPTTRRSHAPSTGAPARRCAGRRLSHSPDRAVSSAA